MSYKYIFIFFIFIYYLFSFIWKLLFECYIFTRTKK